jgi:GTP pyrophosphokinase
MAKSHYHHLYPDQSFDLEKWLHHIAKKTGDTIAFRLKPAAHLAQIVGEDQLTFIERSCLQIGLEMAEIIVDHHMDRDTIAGALLYPCVQYDQIDPSDIQDEVGVGVATLLRGVKQLEAVHSVYHYSGNLKKSPPQLDNLRRMLLAIVDDVRVVTIKLAERLVMMRYLKILDPSLQQGFARETMDIYAPLANRLGMGQLKWELEDFAFRFLNPEAYQNIASHLDVKRSDRENYIDHIILTIKNELTTAGITEVQIFGRAKHIYSIYRKMQRKNVGYEEIYDVSAVRVLVNTIAECYKVLSVVHNLWPHVASEFDDYIAHPKSNGYRSIHTAVIGPNGHHLEVQIRTKTMHDECELGVAAHWAYKEGEASKQKGYENKIALLRQVLEWQKNLTEQSQTETAAMQPFDDHVYVFTPQGAIIDLPAGATPLDFAYHIHSELGHHCRGAKVNGKLVALNQPLNTGEQVEILSARQSTPSRDWLNPQLGFLKTSRARAKVHHWFKQEHASINLIEGQLLLERELRKANLLNVDLQALAQKFKLQNPSELFIALATHEVKISSVIGALQPPKAAVASPVEQNKVVTKTSASNQIIVSGLDNVLTNIARCCKPIPGDPITGFITKSRGITVHHQLCVNCQLLQSQAPERVLPVAWSTGARHHFSVDIEVSAHDYPGLFRDITSVISNEKVNMSAIQSKVSKHSQTLSVWLTLEIQDVNVLDRVFQQLQKVPGIIRVNRRLDS